ncbi:MAG: DUF2341 domain-containing protein [Canidatus Methanoxibalbensis ujae]|nr:DUF2341 domain-containing protein [Candidatus Methanoxibalbensis ujae]
MLSLSQEQNSIYYLHNSEACDHILPHLSSDLRVRHPPHLFFYFHSDQKSQAISQGLQVPLIPANGETKIKMYYGNPSAGAVSDGDKVFEFFDDFESGVIDTTNKWEFDGTATIVDNPYPIGEDKVLDVSYDHYLYSKNTFPPPFAYRCSGASSFGFSPNIGVVTYQHYDSTSGGTQLFWRAHPTVARPHENAWESAIKYEAHPADWSTAYSSIPPYQYKTWFVGETVVKNRSYHAHYVNGILVKEWTGTMIGNINPGIRVIGSHDQAEQYIDWVFIRKYADPEPTLTLSAEYPTTKPTPTPPKPPEGKIKAVWLYDYDRYDLPTLMNDLKSAGINTIFLSTDVNNIWKYERFVKTAHENGIEVHAMILEIADNKEEGIYDYTNFYKNPYHKDEAVRDVEEILNYNEKSLGAFDGINIDIEPYTSDLWNSNREDVWNDYMEVINAIKEKINGRIELSADILYDSRDYTDDKIKDLASVLDFFVIMAYDSGGSGFNTPEEIKDAVAQEMGSVRGQGAKAVIGIGIHEGFGDKSDVESCINDLFDYYSDDPAFLGISIFRYHSYSELPDTKKTPEGNRSTEEQKEIPGFECIFAITLLAVAYILRWLKNE